MAKRHLEQYDKNGTRLDIYLNADEVNISNENFEGTDLDDVLDEIAEGIDNAGSGNGTVTGVKMNNGTPIEPDSNGVVDLGTVITSHQDISGKADKSEMSVTAGTDANADKTTIQLKNGTSATVLTTHQDISGKADKSTTYTKTEVDAMIEDVEAGATVVVGTGDVALVEGPGYIDLVILVPEISVNKTTVSLDNSSNSETLTITGSHLKGNIGAALSGTDAASFSLSKSTITQSDGSASDTLTVSYTGDTTDTSVSGKTAKLTLTSTNAQSVEVNLLYSYASGPTILANPASLSLKAAGGETDSATVAVSGINLEDDITVAITGTDAGKFSVSANTIAESGGVASDTLTVTYSPQVGDSGTFSANLVLSSTNASPVTVALEAGVTELSVSPGSLSMEAEAGSSVTETFTVQGANLTEGVTLNLTDSNNVFSISPASLTKAEAEAGATVTVTYAPSVAGSHSGSVGVSSSGISDSVTLGGTATEVPNFTSENSYRQKYNNIYYDLLYDIENQPYLRVNNKNYDANNGAGSYSGDVIIPSTVTAKIDGANAQSIPVKDIRTNAMSGCTGLTSIVIPDSVTGIHDYAFWNTGLTSVVIGNGVTALTNYCFGGATTYDLIDFGENLADLGSNSVIRMKSTGKVYLRFNGERQSGGTTYYTVKGTSRPFKDASGNMPSLATLYVASGRAQYFNASNDWTTMFGSNITEITE